MKTFQTLWLLVLGLAAIVVGLCRHIIADLLEIPRPPGQYIIVAVAVAIAALALVPIFVFRRR